jgi:hydrogenase maturation protease
MDTETSHSSIRLLGVGNEFRQDDGIGIFIVRHPSVRHLSKIEVGEAFGEATRLMDFWKDAGTVFVFDAVFSENVPGTIYRFDGLKESLPGDLLRLSSHTFSLVEAIELSRVLDRLPKELIIFGIEGKNFGWGQDLSLECEQAALKVIRCVLNEVQKFRQEHLL